jgi:hypothetical protein
VKPNLPLAVVFGLLAPGAGIVYAGRWRIGVAVVVATLAGFVLVPWLVATDVVEAAKYPSILLGFYVVTWGASAIAGAVAALKSTQRVHPWWVLGCVIAIWLGKPALDSFIITPHLLSTARAEISLEPEVHEGAMLVVKKQYAPSEIKPGALVLVGDHVQRVTSTSSGIELNNGTRVAPADVLGIAVPAG